MKKILLVMLITASSLFSQFTFAVIIEIKTMSQILPYIDHQTLLVFDLDNTVLEPVQTLGSDQWFKSLLANGAPLPQAISVWTEVQKRTQVKAVEEITRQIIANAQAHAHAALALTARPSDLSETTEIQLNSIGVSFRSSSSIAKDSFNSDQNSARFINGIKYIGPSLSKGDALVEMINQMARKPRRVVFVDDLQNIPSPSMQPLIQQVFRILNFRHGAADEKVQSFNPVVAQAELKVFQNCGGLLISDALALTISPSEPFQCPNFGN
ncbi:MAG: DUF2608 domain-containing protein [Bdellovibrionales bacterium]|nr:DUF2608 domain-containing protein [Bdellovibrionales bacterium]